MGQELRLKHVSSAVLELLIENPQIVDAFLCLEPGPPTPVPSTDAAWIVEQLRTVSTAVEALHAADHERIKPFLTRLVPEWTDPGLSLGKRWRSVQSLLAGNPHGEGDGLLANAIRGANILSASVDDGPVRYFDAAAVAAVGMELARNSGERLRLQLRDVSGWDCGQEAVSDYASIARYYRDAIAMDRAMLFYD